MTAAAHPLLEALRALHAETMAATEALDALIDAPPPERQLLSDARRRLGEAAAALTRCLERQVYPELIARLPPAEADRVRDLQGAADKFRALANTYMRVWPTDKALASWDQYRSASRAMRDRIRQQVEAEASLLYPLLER